MKTYKKKDKVVYETTVEELKELEIKNKLLEETYNDSEFNDDYFNIHVEKLG